MTSTCECRTFKASGACQHTGAPTHRPLPPEAFRAPGEEPLAPPEFSPETLSALRNRLAADRAVVNLPPVEFVEESVRSAPANTAEMDPPFGPRNPPPTDRPGVCGPVTYAPANPKDAQALRDGKVPLDLIEHAAEVEIAKAMHTGALKYGRRNFCHPDTPILATTYGAAVRRHVGAWLAGEDNDPDTGLSHWAHIGANVNVVLGSIAAGTFIDDRAPVAPTAASARSNARHSGS